MQERATVSTTESDLFILKIRENNLKLKSVYFFVKSVMGFDESWSRLVQSVISGTLRFLTVRVNKSCKCDPGISDRTVEQGS